MTTRVNHYIDTMFGAMPPEPSGLQTALVHQLAREWGVLQVWRVTTTDLKLSWLLRMHWPLKPSNDAPQILLSPDGCWPQCLDHDAVVAVLARGIVAASIDRLDVAHDPPNGERAGPLVDAWSQHSFGVLSAWAWAMGQTVQAIEQCFPAAQIGVMGHSRGGKAALLAAACYPSIAAVISHNSGTAGASSLQQIDLGAESLQSLARAFPHWLGPRAGRPELQAELIADDGEALLKTIAPRGLMIIQAQDDLWANPAGARHRYEQLQSSWGERPDAFTLLERSGGHAISPNDWAVAADFLRGLRPPLRQ